MRNLLTLLMLLSVFSVTSSPAAMATERPWQQLPEPKPLPDPASSGYAWINGIQLYFETFGQGEPVLLLHGALGNANYWGNQVPVLAKKYRVIVIDARGHGRSTRDGKLFSYRLLAADVIALLDLLKIDKVSIIGWSDGGNTALQLAIQHPERLRRLFIFSANYKPSGYRLDVDQNDNFVRYIELARRDYLRLSGKPHGYEIFLQLLSIFWGSEPDFSAEQLKHISLPIIIAAGDHDEAIRREHTEALARMIPSAKLLILPDVSFFAMWQNPQLFNQALLLFLAGK